MFTQLYLLAFGDTRTTRDTTNAVLKVLENGTRNVLMVS